MYYWPKVSNFFFFPWGFIYRRCQNNVWFLVISNYFHKTTNQFCTENIKITDLKDCKNCQENVSFSLTNTKLVEKIEWKFSNQSGELMYAFIYLTLPKISQFHLISWCGNFVERHSFHIVSDDSPETMRKLCLSTIFPHQEIRWNYGIFRSVTNRRKSLLFSVTLFRVWLYDSYFIQIKFRCSENIGDVPGTYPWWNVILLKL